MIDHEKPHFFQKNRQDFLKNRQAFLKNRQALGDEPMNRLLGRQGSFTAA
jgi:hypothetical protein